MKYLIISLSIILVLLSCNDQPAEPNKEDSGFVKLNFSSYHSTFEDAYYLNENIIWVATRREIYHTKDGGISWDTASLPNNSAYKETQIYFSDENTGWLTQNYLGLYRTSDGGKTWELIKSTDHQVGNLNKFYFFNNYRGILITSFRYKYAYMYITTDGGANWDKKTFNVSDEYERINLSSICFLDDNIGFMGVYEGNQDSSSKYLLKTTDSGNSWFKTNSKFENSVSNIFFINSLTGWLSCRSILYKTTDGGINWFISKTLGERDIINICFVDVNYGWITHWPERISEFNHDTYQMQKTSDGGNTWHYVNWAFKHDENPQPFYPEINDMFFIDRNIGWVFKSSGHIYKTTNGGNIVK